MLFFKTTAEVKIIRENSLLLSELFSTLNTMIKDKVLVEELDSYAVNYLNFHNAKPVFPEYSTTGGFPQKAVRIIVHNDPNRKELQIGDVISISCYMQRNGFISYLSTTKAVEAENTETSLMLCKISNELKLSTQQLKEGNRTGDFAKYIANFCRSNNLQLVNSILGHGLGQQIIERPFLKIPLLYKGGQFLKKGMILAIKPEISFESRHKGLVDNGCALNNQINRVVSHFGFTVAVDKGTGEILT